MSLELPVEAGMCALSQQSK